MKLLRVFVILSIFPAALAAADSARLSPKELEALRLASEWTEREIKPIQTAGGKVVYVYGSTMPTIIGAPMQISDIELQAGELVNEILLGDTARWMAESGSSGDGIAHVFVKPLDAGLNTTLVITTNKRVYHLRLVSQKTGHTPYVGFLYPEQAAVVAERDRKERKWNTAEVAPGQVTDITGLDFGYQVRGRSSWKPTQVYNDGRQTFLKLPDSAAKAETPVLLALRGKTEQLVNYRYRNNTFEVDGIFEHLVLISGVGRSQERVDVVRSVKR